MDKPGSPVTDLNVTVGTVVRRNSNWDAEWGEESIHPPHNITGVILGYTDRSSEPTGNSPSTQFASIARVQWEGYDGHKDVRIGFADEFWLEVVSGAVHRDPPLEFGGLFDRNEADVTGFAMCRLRDIEDPNGQPVAYSPPPPTQVEIEAPKELQLFWRIHAGDVEAVERILSEEPHLANARIQPCEFPADEPALPWPYSEFDGEYNDTPAMLACRYCHASMLKLLLDVGGDAALVNDAGDTCVSIAADPSKLAMYEFSDKEGASKVMQLLPEAREAAGAPVELFPQSVCVRRSFCELSTCVDAGQAGIKWLLVNGHSDPEQVEYCEAMVQQWRQTLTKRGDTVQNELSCPSKAQWSAAMRELFEEAAGAACGLFVICHGGQEQGQWVSFNQADEDECFAWEDIEQAGLYAEPGPAQLFIVGDSCYSAKMGKTGFSALRSRHLSGDRVPVCSMLMASEKPEKNFSCMFALEALRARRKLSRATCERVVDESPKQQADGQATLALEIVEDITVDTDDHDPFFFFYAPIDAITNDSVVFTL